MSDMVFSVARQLAYQFVTQEVKWEHLCIQFLIKCFIIEYLDELVFPMIFIDV